MAGQGGNYNRVRFALNISQDVLLSYYQGMARAVAVKSLDGRGIQFPANALRPFVTSDGVRGIFEVTFDENNKLVDMQRISD